MKTDSHQRPHSLFSQADLCRLWGPSEGSFSQWSIVYPAEHEGMPHSLVGGQWEDTGVYPVTVFTVSIRGSCAMASWREVGDTGSLCICPILPSLPATGSSIRPTELHKSYTDQKTEQGSNKAGGREFSSLNRHIETTKNKQTNKKKEKVTESYSDFLYAFKSSGSYSGLLRVG